MILILTGDILVSMEKNVYNLKKHIESPNTQPFIKDLSIRNLVTIVGPRTNPLQIPREDQ